MKKFYKTFLSGLLAAAMIFTSVPEVAFAKALPEADTEILAEEISAEAGEDIYAPDTIEETAENLGEAIPDSTDTEEIDPEGSLNGVTIDVDSLTHAGLYTVNGDVATAAADGTVPSEQDYVVYIVPTVGFALADTPVTVTASYTDDNDVAHDIVANTDWTISAVDVNDITDNPVTNIPLQKDLSAGDFYWNQAKKLTIKASYLTAWEAGKTNSGKIAIADNTAAGNVEFDIPIYVYDTTLETPAYSLNRKMSAPVVVYGTNKTKAKVALETNGIDLSNAVSPADWEAYNWDAKVAMIESDLSVADDTGFLKDASVDDTGDYYFDSATKKLTLGKDSVDTIDLGYLKTQNSLGDARFAIILTKSAKAATTNYTISAADTDFVDFTFEDETGAAIVSQSVAYNPAGASVLAVGTPSHEEIIAEAKAYGSPAKDETLPDSASPKRDLAKETEAVQYKVGDEDAVGATWSTDHWEVPGSLEGNIVLTATTTETVVVKAKTTDMAAQATARFTTKNGKDSTEPIDLTENSKKGAVLALESNETNAISVYPKEGYSVKGVYLTTYSADGTRKTKDSYLLPGTDNVYTIGKVSGYTVVEIETEAVSNKLSVVKSGGANSHLVDVKTREEVSTSGLFAESGKPYLFKVLTAPGYTVASDGVTAKVNGEAVEVSYDATSKIYTIAGTAVTDEITITITETAGLAVTNFGNEDVSLAINGTEVADNGTITVSGTEKLTFAPTLKNGGEVTGVYYSTKYDYASKKAIDAALTGHTNDTYALTKVGTTYSITAQDVTALAEAHKTHIYVYVTTTREAVKGTDYDTVTITDDNITPNDVTSGLTLFADDGSNTSGVNSVANRTLLATWKKGTSTVKTSNESVTERAAFTLEKTAPASVAAFTQNVISPATYKGGTAASDSDNVKIEAYSIVSGDVVDFPNTVKYTATLPLTIKPLSSYYKTYQFKVVTAAATAAGLPENTIRVNGGGLTDNAVFTPQGKGTDADPEAVAVDLKMNTGTGIVAASGNNGILWTTSPAPGTVAATAKYSLNGAYIANNVKLDTATIAAAKEAQDITVSGKITFVDGSSTTISDTLKVVAADYGYYAMPTVTVSGTPATSYDNSTLAMKLEKSGVVTSGTIDYTVYHALTAAGATALQAGTYADAAAIDAAIKAKAIEKLDGSAITWTSLVPAEEKYADYVTINGTNGSYTVTAKNKTTANITLPTTALTATVKSNGYKVKDLAQVNISVANTLAKYNVVITTKDDDAATDYKNPVLTWDAGYSKSNVLNGGKVEGTALLNVPGATTFTLPSAAQAFDESKLDPKRTLAGWYDGSVYYAIGDTFTTEAAALTNLTAIWAPKYASTDGSVARSSAGTILAINKNTDEEVTNPLNVAVGESVQLLARYYKLDTTEAPNATDSTYTEEVTVTDTSKLELKASDAVLAHSNLGADEAGVFPNSTITGKEEMLGSVNATLTYKESADVEYEVSVSNIAATAAETWVLEVDPLTETKSVELGQTDTISLKTLTVNGTPIALSDAAIVGSVKFSYSKAGIVEVTQNTNKLNVEGLAVGTTTVTMSFISASGNKPVSTTFDVTVRKADVNIIVKVTNVLANSYVAPEAVTIGDNDVAQLEIGAANKIDLSATDAEGTPIDANITFNAITITEDGDYPTTSAKGGSDKAQTITPNTLGSAKITITAVSNGKTYTRTIDAVSFGVVKLYGPASGSTDAFTIGGTVNQSVAFKVFKGDKTVADNEVGAGEVSYIPVVFDAAKSEADSYSIGVSGYNVEWLNTDLVEDFLGWGATNADISKLSSDVEVAANGTLTLEVSKVTTGADLYAYFGDQGITGLTGLPTEISLTDEKVDADSVINAVAAGKKAAESGTNWAEYSIQVAPASSPATISVTASEAWVDLASKGSHAASTTKANYTDEIDTTGVNKWSGIAALELVPNTGDSISATTTSRTDNLRIAKVDGQTGVAYLYVETAAKKYDAIPVYLNGEYTKNGVIYYMEKGEDVKSTTKTVKGKVHVYDETGAYVAAGPADIIVDNASKKVMVDATGALLTTSGTYVYDGNTYYIDENGYVVTATLIPAGTAEEVARYANSDGVLVTYAMANEGKYTDPVTGIVWIIDKDTNEAKADHTEHIWEAADAFNWSGYSLSGKTGVVTLTFTCANGGEEVIVEANIDTSKSNGKDEAKVTAITATVSVDPDGNKLSKAITETKYVKADGTEGTKADFNKAAGSSESGSSQGEAVQTGQSTVNLFYTDVELNIPLPSDVDLTKVDPKAKWPAFYKVESDGKVTVTAVGAADRKKAATAANSLIIIPRVDSEGKVIGDFEYSLPVSYVKPTLKLTSTKGSVMTGAGEQVLITKVTEKKSTGAFEPLDISDQDTEKVPYYTAKSGTVVAEAGDNTGEIAIRTSAKASGKIGIQLPNWTEKIELAYTVAQSNKTVVTASTKQINVNMNADKETAEPLSFNIFVNGNEATSEDAITVTLPKRDPGLVVTGIEDGKLTDSEVTFAFGEGTPVKGTYTYKFAAKDGGSVSVKVAVVNTALINKAVTLKVQGKMDIINKTPMVLIPTLKGVSGEITDVNLGDDADFEVEYNNETNQIIVTPVDWTKVSATNYNKTFNITVSGVGCTTDVKFKPLAKKPTVKIDKVVLPKEKVKASTEDNAALGTANVYAYTKVGGKTFSIAPDKVEFLDGKNVIAAADDGWVTVSKSNVKVTYNEEDGVIEVAALPGNTNGKLSAVKVQLTFGTVTVAKSVSIKAK